MRDFMMQIIIQPQSAAATSSQFQLVGGQLVQVPSGHTVVYQPTQQTDAGSAQQQQQQQIQTIQIQNPGRYFELYH